MRRFAVAICLFGVLNAAAGFPFVLKLDLSPEEAQQLLKDPPGAVPELAPRTATLPLIKYNDPRFRSGEGGPTNGHYWKNGHEIDNTDDFVEEIYDSSQFHGQDGLGAFAYGYSVPESFKAEQRERNGEVKGYYAYRDPGNYNQLIKVNYWADKDGFHQEDNIPRVQLEPAQETDEVREARLAHEKAWQEAAAAAAANPDPAGEYDPSLYEYDSQASGKSDVRINPDKPENPEEPREGKALNKIDEEEEPPKNPRGFFYSFHYDTPIILEKSEVAARDAQAAAAPPASAPEDSVLFQPRIGAGAHDTQVPRKPADRQ